MLSTFYIIHVKHDGKNELSGKKILNMKTKVIIPIITRYTYWAAQSFFKGFLF